MLSLRIGQRWKPTLYGSATLAKGVALARCRSRPQPPRSRLRPPLGGPPVWLAGSHGACTSEVTPQCQRLQ